MEAAGAYLVGRAESVARAVVPEVLADLTGAFDAHGSADGRATARRGFLGSGPFFVNSVTSAPSVPSRYKSLVV